MDERDLEPEEALSRLGIDELGAARASATSSAARMSSTSNAT